MTEQQRRIVVMEARKLIGIPYRLGAEWEDLTKDPVELDCSELVQGCYTLAGLMIPDGSQFQFNATIPTQDPQPGDLAFFGKSKDPKRVYHVGIVFDNGHIIEARAFDPSARFPTGMVILRPRDKWESYKNFLGYRRLDQA